MNRDRPELRDALEHIARRPRTPRDVRERIEHLHAYASRAELIGHMPEDAPGWLRTMVEALPESIRQIPAADLAAVTTTAYAWGGRRTADRRHGLANWGRPPAPDIRRAASAYAAALADGWGENNAAGRFARAVGDVIAEMSRHDARACIPDDLPPRLAAIAAACVALLTDDELAVMHATGSRGPWHLIALLIAAAALIRGGVDRVAQAAPTTVPPPRDAPTLRPLAPRAPATCRALSVA
ncbi:hypothetical protein [uncultured Microbacterium sp.]|uniref:hypothetical protein n=1 Tax=uncultured Microbacterium sp. TaxID=191216 RepID=UPI0025EB792B|nr:hypothetical protein [uncultured Microbacterium sp.]